VGDGCHNELWRIPKRYTGPKGPGFFCTLNAALKGPLFHGIIGGSGYGEALEIAGRRAIHVGSSTISLDDRGRAALERHRKSRKLKPERGKAMGGKNGLKAPWKSGPSGLR